MHTTKALNPNTDVDMAKDLGWAIRTLRRHLRMKPAELAGLAGVSEKVVPYWESGRRTISNKSLPRVAVALRTTPSLIYRLAEWHHRDATKAPAGTTVPWT